MNRVSSKENLGQQGEKAVEEKLSEADRRGLAASPSKGAPIHFPFVHLASASSGNGMSSFFSYHSHYKPNCRRLQFRDRRSGLKAEVKIGGMIGKARRVASRV